MGRPKKVDTELYASLKRGDDPALVGADFKYTTMNMIHAFNWYSGNHDVKAARPWVTEYMRNHGYTDEQIAHYERSETWQSSITMCAIARLINQGCKLEGEHENFLRDRIALVLKKTVIPTVVEFTQPSIDTSVVDSLLDAFYKNDYKMVKGLDVHQALVGAGVKGYHASHLIRHLKPILKELDDPDASSHLTKRQIERYREFGSFLIEQFRTYDKEAPSQKQSRKPRKRKHKTAEQLVKKAKYKSEDKTLGLVGKTPEQIVGARFAWLFNTRYMKLSKCVAPEGQQLSFKGSTIQNLDEKLSKAKRISKIPKLKEILDTTRARAEKLFAEYRGTEQYAPGRLTEDTLIVRVDK